MKRSRTKLLAAIALVLSFGTPAFAQLPPLIPREVLVGNPVKASPRISPDGTRLSYLAPSAEGILNVWVRTIGAHDDAQVTNDTHRGIQSYFWAEDGKHLMYVQDIGGDENWHVYSADLGSKIIRDLTPFQGIRAQDLMTDKKHPNEILVGLNLRDRRVFDMFRVDLLTGALVLDTVNPGDVVSWQTDPDFQIRAAVASNPKDGSTILRVRDSKEAAWRELIVWPFGESGDVVDFTADGRGIFVTSTLGSDTDRLVKVDATNGKELAVLASNPKSDVDDVMVQPDTHVVQAASFDYLKKEWTVIDPSIEEDFNAISKIQRGIFTIVSRDRADKNWIVAYQRDNGPVAWYVYHRDSRKVDFLFSNRPELEKYRLAGMKPYVIEARDGLQLVSYLTLPVGLEGKNLPLVLNVHGGPWARDTWGYDP